MIDPPNNTPIDGAGTPIPGAWREWYARVALVAGGDSGPTADRPTKGLYIGKGYFDTTLGYPVYLASVKPSVWVAGPPVEAVEAVITPTFLNAWADSGGAFQTTGYWKDPAGVVHLRGLINGGTMGLAAFTLPVGYRPAATESFAQVSDAAFGALKVLADGSVIPAAGSNVSFWLSGITFRV